jgi:succinyl-diaminopimelate desuccinylase
MTNSQETSQTLEFAMELIRRRSVTPDDAGCQELIATRLKKLGFEIESLKFGDVSNLWARKGDAAPLFVFAGHTDVVPPGPDYTWKNPPFAPKVIDGNLHGRGSADMKSSIASFISAAESFSSRHPDAKGSIALLLTSDEEGVAVDGTKRVVQVLGERGIKIDFCVVGESTSADTACDTMKNGRRGSLGAKLKVKGIQGHVAYPERALNPIHASAAAIAELSARKWDEGNEFFSPTTMQFSNIQSGTGADNVIPGSLDAMFNFRFSSAVSADYLREETEKILKAHKLDYEIEWRISGEPFLTQPGALTDAVRAAVKEVAGIECQFSTTGGTSDARFIAPTGAQVIELGLVNATIHKANEHVLASDLDLLARVYERILELLLL